MKMEKIEAAPPVPAGQRKKSRLRVGLPAAMMSASTEEPCVLVDISTTGARFTASEAPKPGAMVMVRCLELELFGTLVWRRQGMAGMEFDEPLPLEQVVNLRGRAEEVAQLQQQDAQRAAQAWAAGHGSG